MVSKSYLSSGAISTPPTVDARAGAPPPAAPTSAVKPAFFRNVLRLRAPLFDMGEYYTRQARKRTRGGAPRRTRVARRERRLVNEAIRIPRLLPLPAPRGSGPASAG